MEHSKNFEVYKQRYQLNYITEDQLKRWVVLNAQNPKVGITVAEYKEITGKDYQQ